MSTGCWCLELFLSKQCGLEEAESAEGWRRRSTCIFVQTSALVMSSLDSKHLSVFQSGSPDPRSLVDEGVNEGDHHLRPKPAACYGVWRFYCHVKLTEMWMVYSGNL